MKRPRTRAAKPNGTGLSTHAATATTPAPRTDPAKLLGDCFLFRALDADARRELAAHATRRSYAAGAPIFHMGDPGDSMMAVLTGTVRITLPTRHGKEMTLADVPKGELFGEIALIDGQARSAAATALTRCELLVLDRRDVMAFLQRSPDACLKLLAFLCARIRRSDERMSDVAFLDLRARLAKTLLRESVEAGRAPHRSRLSLSQGELANMIGGTRENVNRYLKDWQRRGVLEIDHGWISIRHREAILALVDDG